MGDESSIVSSRSSSSSDTMIRFVDLRTDCTVSSSSSSTFSVTCLLSEGFFTGFTEKMLPLLYFTQSAFLTMTIYSAVANNQ